MVGNDVDFSFIMFEVECLFYGEVFFYLLVQFFVNDFGVLFWYNVWLEQFLLFRVNVILVEVVGFCFKSGMVDEFILNVVVNVQQVEGEMWFFYKDLDIQYLDSDFKLVKKILNGVVEGLVFFQENLVGEKYCLGKIYVDCDDSCFVFYYLWQFVLLGIKFIILFNLVLFEELKYINVELEEDGLRYQCLCVIFYFSFLFYFQWVINMMFKCYDLEL